MPRIYTRIGDSGDTGLFGGVRVRKDDRRIVAIGAVDEINAALGVARAELPGDASWTELCDFIVRVQHQLFGVGAELATPEPATHGGTLVRADDVQWLEQTIDGWEQALPPLSAFILPGGSRTAAQLHWARTACRRAERAVVALAANEPLRSEVLRYLNRLSDALFVAARTANRLAGVPDVVWQQTH